MSLPCCLSHKEQTRPSPSWFEIRQLFSFFFQLKSLLIERSCLEPVNVANLFVKQEALGVEIKQNVKLPAFFCTVANLKNRFQLLIGLGSPYEEALALEAISHGCIFINPKVRSFNFAFNFSPYVFPIAASVFFEICSSFITFITTQVALILNFLKKRSLASLPSSFT